MSKTRTIKLKYGLPFQMESHLVNKLGYFVVQRVYNDYIMFSRHETPGEPLQKKDNVVPFKGDSFAFADNLGVEKCKELCRRCDNIVKSFNDPYKFIGPVRQRLHNMSQGLPLREQQYVQDYMDEHFPHDEDD